MLKSKRSSKPRNSKGWWVLGLTVGVSLLLLLLLIMTGKVNLDGRGALPALRAPVVGQVAQGVLTLSDGRRFLLGSVAGAPHDGSAVEVRVEVGEGHDGKFALYTEYEDHDCRPAWVVVPLFYRRTHRRFWAWGTPTPEEGRSFEHESDSAEPAAPAAPQTDDTRDTRQGILERQFQIPRLHAPLFELGRRFVFSGTYREIVSLDSGEYRTVPSSAECKVVQVECFPEGCTSQLDCACPRHPREGSFAIPEQWASTSRGLSWLSVGGDSSRRSLPRNLAEVEAARRGPVLAEPPVTYDRSRDGDGGFYEEKVERAKTGDYCLGEGGEHDYRRICIAEGRGLTSARSEHSITANTHVLYLKTVIHGRPGATGSTEGVPLRPDTCFNSHQGGSAL